MVLHYSYFKFSSSSEFSFSIIFLLIFPILLFIGFIRQFISVDKKFILSSSLLEISRINSSLVIIRQSSRSLSHTKSMMKINWDLRELWRSGWGLEKSPKIWGVFTIVITSAIKNSLQKQQSKLAFAFNACKCKAN